MSFTKIQHVSISDSAGGAARAAYRIHRALINYCINSALRFVDKGSGDISVKNGLPPKGLIQRVVQRVQRRDFLSKDIEVARQRTELHKRELDDAVVKASLYWAKLMQRQGNVKAAHGLCWNAVRLQLLNKTALCTLLSSLLASVRGWYC
jgi:hypothetical protein